MLGHWMYYGYNQCQQLTLECTVVRDDNCRRKKVSGWRRRYLHSLDSDVLLALLALLAIVSADVANCVLVPLQSIAAGPVPAQQARLMQDQTLVDWDTRRFRTQVLWNGGPVGRGKGDGQHNVG
jgi:hypothetical protein